MRVMKFGGASLTRGGKKNVTGGTRFEDGLHYRLAQPPHSRARPRIAPSFQRVMDRQQQTRHRRGFVGNSAEPGDEWDFLEGLRDLESRRHGEDRIYTRHDQRIDFAVTHGVELRTDFIRRCGIFGRSAVEKQHRAAKIPGNRVEQVSDGV